MFSSLCFFSFIHTSLLFLFFFSFFLNDTAPTEIYTLSLHDALPISSRDRPPPQRNRRGLRTPVQPATAGDRKSTRLNSSHVEISYAVFCLKKKKKHKQDNNTHKKKTKKQH